MARSKSVPDSYIIKDCYWRDASGNGKKSISCLDTIIDRYDRRCQNRVPITDRMFGCGYS